MKICNLCSEWVKKSKYKNKIDLLRSFTKIADTLHLGFDSPFVCKMVADYMPETIVLAGNGAVEIKGGGSCWTILENKMKSEGLLGPKAYQNPLDALTWLVAQNDFLKSTINHEEPLRTISEIKERIVKTLQQCDTLPREIYCKHCSKKFKLQNSEKILILTTNWDLGLFKVFKNVIQVNGRSDYPEQAVLPLQNISLLMAQTVDDIERLNCGILPGPFLHKVLQQTRNFIFWGTGLNDYDAALWHFLGGFIRTNPNVQLGIATKNDEESYKEAKGCVTRFFFGKPINDCLCQMIQKNS